MSVEADKKVSVFIADKSPIIRERLINLISDHKQVEIAGEAETAPELMQIIPQLKPDIVILDIRLPGGGIAALNHLKKYLSPVVVIILTNQLSVDYHRLLLDEGADYVFDKYKEFEKILSVIAERVPGD